MSSRSLLSGPTHDSASQSTIAEPTLLVMLEGSAEDASKACEALRRSLSHNPVTLDVAAVAGAVLRVLERYPGQLRVSHLCVAVLAHPALNAAPHPFEPAVLRALERLSLSAAFVHTALAALQNAASANAKPPRDPVLNAVVASMRQHQNHTGILLRAADLIAFHLNQPIAPPSSKSYDICGHAVIGASPRLYASPQGASAGLLALVACVRQSASSFSNQHHSVRLRSSERYSNSIVDSAFASVVVQAMLKHKDFPPVQVLSAELIRVAGSGSANSARMAAREFFHAGALNSILVSMHAHQNDDTVVERALAALRSLLLLGTSGSNAKTAKPTVPLSSAVAEAVVNIAENAVANMNSRNPDVASLAKVLAADIRIAAASASSSSISASSNNPNQNNSSNMSSKQNGASGNHNFHLNSAGGNKGNVNMQNHHRDYNNNGGTNGNGGKNRENSSRSFSVLQFGRRFARSLRMGGRKGGGDDKRNGNNGNGNNGNGSNMNMNMGDGPPSSGRFNRNYASGHVIGSPPMGGASGSALQYGNSVNLANLRASNGGIGINMNNNVDEGTPPLNTFKTYGSSGIGIRLGASSSLVSGRSDDISPPSTHRWRGADSPPVSAGTGQRWSPPVSATERSRWRGGTNNGGRWRGGKKGSRQSSTNGMDNQRERSYPSATRSNATSNNIPGRATLSLSGPDVAKLTRQPSAVSFTTTTVA